MVLSHAPQTQRVLVGLGPGYRSANYSLLTLVACLPLLPSLPHSLAVHMALWDYPNPSLVWGGTQIKKEGQENRRRQDVLFFSWRSTSSERLSSFCMSPSQEGGSLAQNPLCA